MNLLALILFITIPVFECEAKIPGYGEIMRQERKRLERERQEQAKYINPTKCPSFTTGDGYDFNGSELPIKDEKTGELLQLTPKACIERCFQESISDSSINGVTMFRDNSPGCFCEKKMSKVYTAYGKYKSCLLPSGLTDCPQFAIGDGYDFLGGEEVIEGDLTDAQCVEKCKVMRLENSRINGVTIRINKVAGEPGCFCEKGMKSVASSRSYKTCTLPKDKRDSGHPDNVEEIIEGLSE